MQGQIRPANPSDFADVQALDQRVVGTRLDRSDQIRKAIKEARCHVLSSGSHIQGFAIFSRQSFREMDLLDLLVVHPEYRRQGIATLLINYFKENSVTTECWTSTNSSNEGMISLLRNLGWIKSDYSQELDPGDPDVYFFTHKEHLQSDKIQP